MMTGLADETIAEGHDLIEVAENEAEVGRPADFKKVHRVGETGGSILPDSKPAAPAPAPGGSVQPFRTNGTVSSSLEAKLAELRGKLSIKK